MANTVDKVIDIALNEVGYLEKKSNSKLYNKTANAGSKNYTKYGKEMHDIYPSVMDFPAPYCDAFVDWCFYMAYGKSNAKGLLNGDFNDYTPASAQLYKNKKAWHTSNPKIGDQIFFKNSSRIYHTGLVYKVDSSYVYTIEGNTSGASGVIANGGGVCKKKYSLKYSKIAGYGRPKYDVVEDSKVVNKKTETKKESDTTTVSYSQKDFIKDVQTAIGTKADGIVGVKTLKKLPTVSKNKNRKHKVIKPLQKYLNALGYDCGDVDGIAGDKFDKAVKEWAKDNGRVADGEFTKGGNSWKRILGVI